MDSPVFGDINISIEGVGEQVLDNCQGVSVTSAINVVGAALTRKPFQVNPQEWKAGYRASDNTILVQKKAS
jgi:hypothetical protein